MKRNKAFTLIELVSVLVILAILALIVTPLVLNIIKKARTAADKRSIDAYGRSIELAVADYLLDTGNFPTSIEELTIEYSGDRVECETTKLNSDSSVYLSGCTVNSRTLDYVYGKEEAITHRAYSVGDEVTYNGIDFYVIKNSDAIDSSVTLLKAEPLKYSEVSSLLQSTEIANSIINDNVSENNTGYLKMSYLYKDNCNSAAGLLEGCSTHYLDSSIKQLIDVWVNTTVGSNNYEEARLIKFDELINDLGYEYYEEITSSGYIKTESTPSWLYDNDYTYWTMSPYNDSLSIIWIMGNHGELKYYGVGDGKDSVRPVITIKKSVLN